MNLHHAQPAFLTIWLIMIAIPMLFTPRNLRNAPRFRLRVWALEFAVAATSVLWFAP
jgi:hypothetical protein